MTDMSATGDPAADVWSTDVWSTDVWAMLDAASRLQQYSPSSMIPNLDFELNRYSTVSAAVRRSHPPIVAHYGPHPSETIDIYGPYPSETIDIDSSYPPETIDINGPYPSKTLDIDGPTSGRSPLATVVYFHGGYWQDLGKAQSAFMVADLCALGYRVAIVDYELAPYRAISSIIDQCIAATRLIVQQGVTLGAGGPIIVAGSSAGAHLAAHVCGTVDQVSAAVLLSGIFDLRPLVSTPINHALGLNMQQAAQLSVHPSQWTRVGRLPILVAVGQIETDEFIRQSAGLAHMASGHGHPVTDVIVQGRNHFDLPFDLGRADTVLGNAVQSLTESLR